MAVTVKIDYRDEFVVVEEGVRAEEKHGFLIVYDKDEKIVAKFGCSKVEHWWVGTASKPEPF